MTESTKPEKKAAFVHINKTGGTSILEALGLPKEHLTAMEMRDSNRDEWEDMFTFSMVRNPWDKVVSHYHYRVITNQTELQTSPIPFQEWVMRSYGEQDPFYYDNERMFMPHLDWLRDTEGDIIVDFVGRFEAIDDDFLVVCRELGRATRSLPHLNRSTHLHYSEYYNDVTEEIVGNWFKDDIAQFGYRFEGQDSNI